MTTTCVVVNDGTDDLVKYRYSSRRRIRRQQVAFVNLSLSRLPENIQELIKSLPVEVVFRAWNGRATVCIYHHGEQRIYLPQSFWKDQRLLAKWMKLQNQATLVHECFHALDLNYLSKEDRDSLLLPLTTYPANAHDDYYGVEVPEHISDGHTKAQWVGSTWEWNAAEVFADTGVETFTTLPPKDRSDAGLRVTPEGKEAVYSLLGGVSA